MNFSEQIIAAIDLWFSQRIHDAQEPVRCTEYELLEYCQQNNIEPISLLSLSHSHQLFQAHFLVRHALYVLQQRYIEQGRGQLNITLTRIELISSALSGTPTGHSLTLESASPALRDYYLNLDHLFNTSEHEVNDLLRSFWRRFQAHDQSAAALQVLGLDQSASYREVRQRYRHLAQQHHPDKGGDAVAFSRLQEAMEVLDRARWGKRS